jgi:hypothetical protein
MSTIGSRQHVKENWEIAALLELLRSLSAEVEWQRVLEQVESSLSCGQTVSGFVRALGLHKGVTGYSLHVVAVGSTHGCGTPAISARRLSVPWNVAATLTPLAQSSGRWRELRVGSEGFPAIGSLESGSGHARSHLWSA